MARPREFDRDRALQQAVEVFRRQGYEATSVQELGSALKLNPGSLYNTFKDKHSLFLEALECYQEQEYRTACTLFDETATGRAAIERFFTFVINYDSADPEHKGCLIVNAVAELADRDPQVRAFAVASRDQIAALFQRAIVQGQQSGEINPQRDPATLAAFLVNSLFGLRLMARLQPDRATLQAIAAANMQALD